MANLKALISGCSSGLGLSITEHLLEKEATLQVIGLSRNPGPLAEHQRFEHWQTDLSLPDVPDKRASRYLQEVGQCDLLVHAAGRGLFSPSNEWTGQEIQSLVNLNLSSVITLTGRLSQSLRKHRALVVFIGSTASRERAPLGSAYAACKAGLHHFAENYFQENRKQGVRVLHLCPGMISTNFYQGERFEPESGLEFSVDIEALCELIWFFFRGAGRHINPTHLVLEPQKVGVRKKSVP